MANKKRQGNNLKRRLAEVIEPAVKSQLAEARYVGSALHKSKLADYDFHPPANPRPDKSLCDKRRTIKWAEAIALFRSGIALGMVSDYRKNGLPKYVWAVDADEEVYEAVQGSPATDYHGYCLTTGDPMREIILNAWRKRCEHDA